ncbi:phage minor head protein [Globicatella sp. PHS-GS-PNBC-21-1553]|uniref:phage minor head protein n=1 Tax=Globicatella sp. PHS-GS-PNBC-21-1553 TaxID=2885764 RepID=UPI00298F07DF|nr:phage minor head protein [Globicatella sp. PHS-GS-PNBC-21-1553]WPC08002.1 hypothetical protein LB888_08075 [Globicatella sp. PHS-GS-PNBC-21-1553]
MTKKLNKIQNEIAKLEELSVTNVNKDLWKVYNRINKEIRKNLKELINKYDELPEYQKVNAMRLLSLENQISEFVRDTYNDDELLKIKEIIKGFADEERDDGYFSTMYQVEMETGQELPIQNRVDVDYIRHSVASPINPSLLSKKLYDHREKLAGKAGEALRNGLIQGKGYRDIAVEITRWTESNYKQALRIAITEGHRTRGQAKQKAQEDAVDMGARLEKMWMSALDTRVRSSHRSMDGQVVKVDEEFISPSGHRTLSPGNFGIASEDINCRCSSVTVVNGMKPGYRRDGYGRVIPYKNYEEWKDDLITERGKDWWSVEEKKGKNLNYDKDQHRRYLKQLGSKRVPTSLVNFQEMKYNDVERYRQVVNKANLKQNIGSGLLKLEINKDLQSRHRFGTKQYELYCENNFKKGKPKPSYTTVDNKILQKIINNEFLNGYVERNWKSNQFKVEVAIDKYDYGVAISQLDGEEYPTNRFKIHFRGTGSHIVPMMPSEVDK